MPQYQGPSPAPNRFNIRPGYRWVLTDHTCFNSKKTPEDLSLESHVSLGKLQQGHNVLHEGKEEKEEAKR